MRAISLSVVFLTNFALSSCLHRAESLRMLEVRADYEGKEQDESKLKLASASGPSESRKIGPKTAAVWIFPHETSSREYFHGGWVTVVVEGDRWQPGVELSEPDAPAPGVGLKLKGKQSK